MFDWSKLPKLSMVDEQENPIAVAHFTLPMVADWYVLAGEIEDDGNVLFFGLVDLWVKELGYFNFNELKENNVLYDISWKPVGVYDIYADFDLRK